jgi:NitT/TauT family transport system permease protein
VVIPKLRDIVMPLLLVAQLVPKVAIAPLLLIWFGYGLFPKVLVAFLVAFFPIVVNGASGLASVQPELLDLGHSLQASRWQTFWKFRIPSALPELFSGMKVAVTLAIIGAIIGEFVGGNRGLGYLIIVANQELDTPLAFAAIFLLSAAGIALYAIVEMFERMLIPWHAPSTPAPAAGHAM